MPRAVVVGGARTPFVRAFSEFIELDTVALGVQAVQGALERLSLDPGVIDAVCWGGVVLPPGAPNVGREIVLDAGLPPSVEARTVTRACASGLQAIADGVHAIERGEAEVVIAGGSDSTSNAAIPLPPTFIRKAGPVVMGKGGGAMDYLKLLGRLSLRRDVLPGMPKIAERTTGEQMGEACERMATHFHIGRADQDAFAVDSHAKAHAAWEAGRYAQEVVTVAGVERDTLVRADSTVERLSKLRAVFAEGGTLTAGNSSALTDGAACVVLMSEAAAAKHGQSALAAFSSFAWVGVDPADQLLIGPALAMPMALERAGRAMAEMDRVDLHEAFAAQVLAVLSALEDEGHVVDRSRLNVQGGSLALGHPFGATGARMVLTQAHELASTDARTSLLGICAAGGLGAAAVMEAC